MGKPEAQKFTHDQVGYEYPSTHTGERCVGCKHFIPQTANTPPGCQGVQRPIQLNAWCHRFESELEKKMEHKKKHAGHGFKHTHIEHHSDGTHTVHHIHEDGPEHDVRGAVGSHDAMMDHIMDHTSAPNPGEAAADAGDHGVPPAMASAAGMPPMPAGSMGS